MVLTMILHFDENDGEKLSTCKISKMRKMFALFRVFSAVELSRLSISSHGNSCPRWTRD